MIHITEDVLDPTPLTASVRRDANGAVVTFLGVTRRTSEGRQVLFLEYEGYQPMARKKLEEIRQEIMSKWPVQDVAIAHRLGRLGIEDISLVVAVASYLRAEVPPGDQPAGVAQTHLHHLLRKAQQRVVRAISHLALAFFLLYRRIFHQGFSWISHHGVTRAGQHQIDATES